MKVTNNTSEALIAFALDTRFEYAGQDIRIEPGETKEVVGPLIEKLGCESFYSNVEGKIVCHEGSDDFEGYRVAKGAQLHLLIGPTFGVSVRHFSEDVN